MDQSPEDGRGLFQAALGDGRPMLLFTGLVLALSGCFALFQSCTGQFLPHDVAYLGMTARDLCGLDQCRIVHFMFHDRVAFGGSLIAIGVLYLWMVEFPLKEQQPWAWWLFLISGLTGFATFLTYLGYGYLDTWHGTATIALLPIFLTGLIRSRVLIPRKGSFSSLLHSSVKLSLRNASGLGHLCLLFTAVGVFIGGIVIMGVGMTWVFVP